MAVSLALRNSTNEVSRETRERIIAAAQELGYDPSRNQAARRMALKRYGYKALNHSVGITLPPFFAISVYYSRLLEGFLRAASARGYDTHVVLLEDYSQRIPVVCNSGEIDGIATAAPMQWFAFYADRLRQEPNFGDRPIVGMVEPLKGCSSVHADDDQAGQLVASHLLDLGHRFLLHGFVDVDSPRFGVPEIPDSAPDRRLGAIDRTWADRGLAPTDHLYSLPLAHLADDFDTHAAEVAQLLRERPEITAICAPNDYTAVLVWRALARARIRVPDDISLISFDDTHEILSPDGCNILTTARIPLYEIGAESARLLMNLVENKHEDRQENTLLPTDLIVRGSTAPPRV